MRRTNLQRQIDAVERETQRALQVITQEELNRLWRGLQQKIRRLNITRPGSRARLHKADVVATDIWSMFIAQLKKRLMAELLTGFVSIHDLITLNITGTPLEVDTTQIAEGYAEQIGVRITRTTTAIKRLVGHKIVGWYNSPGMSVQSIVDQLRPAFGAARAQRISQNEITRLDSMVQSHVAQQLGLDEWWWMTKRDQLVCKQTIVGPDGKSYAGCRALHGMKFKVGQPMPPEGSHIGCRCKAILIVPALPLAHVTLPIVDTSHLVKAEFEESEHPRDEDGKFTSSGKGTAGALVQYTDAEWIAQGHQRGSISPEWRRLKDLPMDTFEQYKLKSRSFDAYNGRKESPDSRILDDYLYDRDTKHIKKLGDDTLAAINDYAGGFGSSEKFNAYLRGDTSIQMSKHELENVDLVINAINSSEPLPEDFTVYRGIPKTPENLGLKVGETYTDAAIISTSANRGWANGFVQGAKEPGTMLVMHLPKGSHALGISGVSASVIEHEVLLAPKSKFKVDSISARRGGGSVVTVTMINDVEG